MKGWELRVSQKELQRMHVVRLTMEGRERVGKAAQLLGISMRQMKRLRRRMKEHGVEGLLHGNRGKPPWTKTGSEKIDQVLQLARGRYQGLNDTHLTEKLKEKERSICRVLWYGRFFVRRGLRRRESAGSSDTTRGGSEEHRK